MPSHAMPKTKENVVGLLLLPLTLFAKERPLMAGKIPLYYIIFVLSVAAANYD